MIEKLHTIFQSMVKALEVLYILENEKDVARLAIHEDRIQAVQKFCDDKGLACLKSEFKISLSSAGDYSSKGFPTKGEGHFIIYISKKSQIAELAKKADASSDHALLGNLLGYPDCCIKFFIENFSKESAKDCDFVKPGTTNSKGFIFPIVNNIFARYFDTSLLSHCPHNFNCGKSKYIAEGRLAIIQRHDSSMAEQIFSLLNSAAIYDNGKVYLLCDIKLNENHLTYKHVLSTYKDSLLKKLKNSGSIRIKSKESFELSGEKIKLPILVFSQF